MKIFNNKSILITGGTGSLGKVLTKIILSGIYGIPKKVVIFSRDEAKQHFMRVEYEQLNSPTDEVIYNNFKRLLEFKIGDVRNYHSVLYALQDVDIVVNAAALKQVPSCEYFPFEAVSTNIEGPENIVRAIREYKLPVETVIGVSTDKACKPVNVMGMTKAIQERVFISANISCPDTCFVCVRYGNVLASRGSVIPLFHEQIKNGGPVTITTDDMTRFLLPLEKAVETIVFAIQKGSRGETIIPKVPAAKIYDLAKVLIGKKKIETKITGIRPGEKIHEILISDEEAWRSYDLGEYYAIKPMLPELLLETYPEFKLNKEYSSGDDLMTRDEIHEKMIEYKLLEIKNSNEELLR